jgi:lysophospholipase L1-like esterase
MSWFDGLLDRIISAKPLLAGVVVGLAACAYGGHSVGRVNLFKNFDRFTEETDYRTNYQPSANQVRSVMRSKVRSDQIAVVVAGNSVLLGCGQSPEGVWTHQLQAELGDQYRVVNVALPGLTPSEFGTVGAEMLYKDGHTRMIVLTNTWVAPIAAMGEPDGRPIIQWFYRDAAARGLLLDHPERDARLAQPLKVRVDGATNQLQRDELERQAAIDRWLNYRDLWNAFEYKYGVTMWCKPLAKTWWQARKRYPDRDPLREPALPAVLEKGVPQIVPPLRTSLVHMRPIVRRPNGELIPWHQLGGPFPSEEGLRTNFPAPIRERMIVVASRLNPYYLDQLTADERITYDALAAAMTPIYARAGVQVHEVGRGYTYLEYFDHAHLTVAGGRRMASELAPLIRQKAAKLGYLEEKQP